MICVNSCGIPTCKHPKIATSQPVVVDGSKVKIAGTETSQNTVKHTTIFMKSRRIPTYKPNKLPTRKPRVLVVLGVQTYPDRQNMPIVSKRRQKLY